MPTPSAQRTAALTRASDRAWWPRRGALAALLAGLLAVACGGGGGDAGTPTASTAASTSGATVLTQGTVTGFGSVIVNGVRFDDSGVDAVDDDGRKQVLGLGMSVEVSSGSIDDSRSARAHALRVGAQLLGPVASVAADGLSLVALGQTVDLSDTTVLDDSLSAGLASLVAGDLVEVHGTTDASTGHLVATRIEKKTSAAAYKLRGTVAALDPSAKTFRIGGATISYASLDSTLVPATLADGVLLRVTLATTPLDAAAGLWQATSLGLRGAAATVASGTATEVRGAITAFTSATAFSIDGLVVDASGASFPDGSSGIVLGARVEVHGTVNASGVLVATTVEPATADRSAGRDRHFELHGAITAVDTTAQTFTLRGVTVSYAGSVDYVGGSAAALVVGARVEVRGGVGSTRTLVQATRIRFET